MYIYIYICIYTNPDFGYSIGYPSDWNIQRFPPTAPTAINLTSPDKSQNVLIFVDNSGNMTFQDMLKKDPQGNITGLRTIDTTGNFHLLGQPARRWEYTYTLADPITGYTPKKSITLETIVSGRHIFISMTAPAANFSTMAQILNSFKLSGGS